MAKGEVGRLYPVAKRVITPLFFASWKLEIVGLENLPETGGAILCPNHTSVLDSFFVPAALPRKISYVGKAEYMDDWKTRKLFPALGMIPIDREGGDAAERALATAQRVLEQGELFGIYPEGTRSRDGRLYRGHTGPARLALRTGAPIIPVGLQGAREVMPPDARFPKLRLPVRIEFGEPVDPARYADRGDDRLVLRQIIDEVMFAIRELSGQEYVDEYANKKRSAAAEPTEVVEVSTRRQEQDEAAQDARPSSVAAVTSLREHRERKAGAARRAAEASHPSSRPALDETESAFVEATEPLSSAQVLKRRPQRSASVSGS